MCQQDDGFVLRIFLKSVSFEMIAKSVIMHIRERLNRWISLKKHKIHLHVFYNWVDTYIHIHIDKCDKFSATLLVMVHLVELGFLLIKELFLPVMLNNNLQFPHIC